MMWIILTLAAVVVAAIIYYYYGVYQKPKARELELPYTQGLNYLLEGNIDKAKEKFNQAVHEDTNNLDAYLKLGAILREQGQASYAVKVHQSLTVRSDLKLAHRVEIFKELALDYEKAESFQKAAENAEQILAISKDHRWALEFRIKMAEKLQDWPGAFELTRRLNAVAGIKHDPKLALYRVEEGRALMDAGKGRDGRIKCREAIKQDVSCAHAYLSLAHSYMSESREEDAVKELKKLLEENSEKGYLAYKDLENLYFNLGRFGELEALYRDLISKQPENLEAAKSLARFLKKKGEIDAAIQVCTDTLERHPDDLWSRRFMMRALVETDRIDRIGPLVIEILDRVLVEEPFYTCSDCGYRTKEPVWRCPQCSALDTFNL